MILKTLPIGSKADEHLLLAETETENNGLPVLEESQIAF